MIHSQAGTLSGTGSALVTVACAFLSTAGALRAEEEGGAPLRSGAGESQTRSWVDETPSPRWSDDRQIRVKGGEPYDRVKFTVFSETLREDFRWLLYRFRAGQGIEGRSAWSVPVQLQLWGSFRDVHRGEDLLTEVEIGPDQRFVIKLKVKLHDRFDEAAFRLELVRALLIDQMLAPFAARPGDFSLDQIRPPEWIAHGFDQLILHRRGGSRSGFYRETLERGQFLKPRELFDLEKAEALDPLRRTVFRASASAMVEALLDQPDGDLAMRTFLGEFGKTAKPAAEVLLRQHFPAFREQEQGLEKWWALELASLGQRQGFEFLDRKETERLLTEALTLHFEAVTVAVPVDGGEGRGFFEFLKPKGPAPPPPSEAFTGTIDQYEAYLHRPEARAKLDLAFDRLQGLKRTAFPLYRPVFTAYENAILRLAKGDTKDLAAEFASILEMRRRIGETLIRAEDFLNHFEATRAPRRSGEFDDYLKLRRTLESREAPKRNDAISRHLDALEWEYR